MVTTGSGKSNYPSVIILKMAHCLEITDDTLHGVKLNILLINGGTEGLRRVFDGLVSPPKLQQFLAIKEPEIKKLYRKRIINKSQWDKLYPPVGTSTSKNFDISLLYVLLRSVCGLPAPATGWGTKPSPTDHSVEGAVEMIHWYRNNCGHALMVEVDESSFESSWKEISEAIKVLGEDSSRVENLKATPLFASSCLARLAKFDFSGEVKFHASKHHPGTREWVFSHVEDWFLDRSSDSRVLIITGNAGMGKSVIAAQLCNKMKEREVLGGVHFCQHNNQRRRKPDLMLQSLARQLCDTLPGFKDILTGQLTSLNATSVANMSIEELFTHLLQEPTNMMADPGKNILLVVDALDECEYDGRNELLDVIMSQFHKLPSWIKFIVTGRPENEMADKLAHLRPFILRASDENNERDIELFFKDNLRTLLPTSVFKESVGRFVNQAEGLMLYAHYFIQFLEEHRDNLTPADINSIFPRGIASVYERYFDRLQMDLRVEEAPFSDFLSSLAAARSPLPVTMASRILGLCSETAGSSRQIQKISGSISSLLPIREDCIDVFHKSIVDWLSSPELYGRHRFTVELARGNVVLAKECVKTYMSISGRYDVHAEYTPEEKYALQHGTYHFIVFAQLDGSQKNKLFRYASSLELLFAKLQSKACDVFSIIEELQSIKPVLKLPKIDLMELDDCITCLRRHPYVLTENPKMIFQLLVNEAESVAMSLEACDVMQQPKYQLPLRLEVVNRAQSRDPVITKFRCKTNVNCCDVLKNDEHSLLVCGCTDGFIQMFSLETGRELWCCQRDEVEVWTKEEERCNYCVFVPQHDVVVHGRFDEAVTFDGEPKELFPDNQHTFIDSCISQDRRKMVTRQTHLTADLLIWELDTGKRLARLEQPAKSITCCTFSVCGQFVVSGSFDHGVSLWDATASKNSCQHNTFNDKLPLIVDCLAGLEENSQFVLVNSSKKQSLTVCELVTDAFENASTTIVNLGSAHKSLGVSSHGACLYVCGDSHQMDCSSQPFSVRIIPISNTTRWKYAKEVDSERVLLSDLDTVYMCHTLENTPSTVMMDRGVQAISFSVDGSHVYVSSKVGLSMYEASSGRFLHCNTSISHVDVFTLSPNGKTILIQTKDHFQLWDSKLQHRVKTLEHPITPQSFFGYIDDDLVLFLSRTGAIQVWNLTESTLKETKNSKRSLIECCDIFPLTRKDGNGNVLCYRLLFCDRHGGVTLHDTLKAREITRKVPKEQIVKCCKFSPDGSCIATGHIDGTLQIWDARRLEFKKFLTCGDGLVKGCGYLVQDLGDVVASLSVSGTLRVWDVFSRQLLGFMNFESKLRGIATSPVNAQVCVALEDKIVIVNVHRPEFD